MLYEHCTHGRHRPLARPSRRLRARSPGASPATNADGPKPGCAGWRSRLAATPPRPAESESALAPAFPLAQPPASARWSLAASGWRPWAHSRLTRALPVEFGGAVRRGSRAEGGRRRSTCLWSWWRSATTAAARRSPCAASFATRQRSASRSGLSPRSCSSTTTSAAWSPAAALPWHRRRCCPGRRRTFVVVVSDADRVERYRVSFRTADNVIPHVDRRAGA